MKIIMISKVMTVILAIIIPVKVLLMVTVIEAMTEVIFYSFKLF